MREFFTIIELVATNEESARWIDVPRVIKGCFKIFYDNINTDHHGRPKELFIGTLFSIRLER